MKCPRPGDTFDDATVIASGWINDERIAVMLLRPEPPYYEIAEHSETGRTWRNVYANIVPAARDFDTNFGLWGES